MEVEAQDGGFEADLLLVALYLCTGHSQTAYEGLCIAVVHSTKHTPSHCANETLCEPLSVCAEVERNDDGAWLGTIYQPCLSPSNPTSTSLDPPSACRYVQHHTLINMAVSCHREMSATSVHKADATRPSRRVSFLKSSLS